DGVATYSNLPLSFRRGRSRAAGFSMTSKSPDSRPVSRGPALGTGTNFTVCQCGFSPQYVSLRSSSIPVPLTYDFSLYGPVPMASLPLLKSTTVGHAPVTPQPSLGANFSGPCSTMPFQMMGSWRASSAGISGKGAAVFRMTVWSSGVCTSVSSLVTVMYDCEILVSLFSVRHTENNTSWDVKGSPFENFTPSRSFNSQVRSSRFFQDTARPGLSCMSALR